MNIRVTHLVWRGGDTPPTKDGLYLCIAEAGDLLLLFREANQWEGYWKDYEIRCWTVVEERP